MLPATTTTTIAAATTATTTTTAAATSNTMYNPCQRPPPHSAASAIAVQKAHLPEYFNELIAKLDMFIKCLIWFINFLINLLKKKDNIFNIFIGYLPIL